jgi:hypothetical protein
MTRKLTDEQVKAIKDNFPDNDWVFLNVVGDLIIRLMPCTEKVSPKTVAVYLKCVGTGEFIKKEYFETPDEAIAYAEHLLNQRYCWLPQNNGWIISGEVYNFANNGANKVWELIHIAEEAGFEFDLNAWFKSDCKYTKDFVNYYGCPTAKRLVKGISIDPDSPIWDAVKGVE